MTKFGAALAILLVPSAALADVRITEIMYDPPGSNAGQQWIEVTNTGDTPVSLLGDRLSEGGTNHKLSVVTGTSTLQQGESLIISNGPDQFASTYPAYKGSLLRSAFSLTRAGETIALLSSTLAHTVDMSYASSMGARGDGNSLHTTSEGMVAGAPDPGVYSLQPPQPVVVAPTEQKHKTTRAVKEKKVGTSTLSHSIATQDQSASAAQSVAMSPTWEWVAGLAGVIIFGVGAAQYVRRETQPLPDEFDFE